MNEQEWAIKNIEMAGLCDKDSDYGGKIGDALKEIVNIHFAQGHSGISHAIAVYLINKILSGQSLTLEHWQARLDEYNELAKINGVDAWTEESYQSITKNIKPTPKGEHE